MKIVIRGSYMDLNTRPWRLRDHWGKGDLTEHSKALWNMHSEVNCSTLDHFAALRALWNTLEHSGMN